MNSRILCIAKQEHHDDRDWCTSPSAASAFHSNLKNDNSQPTIIAVIVIGLGRMDRIPPNPQGCPAIHICRTCAIAWVASACCRGCRGTGQGRMHGALQA